MGMWALIAEVPHPGIDGSAFRLLAVSPAGRLGRHALDLANVGAGAAAAFVVVAVVYAARTRRWATAIAIPAGFVLAEAIGDLIKTIELRPRPMFEVIPAGGTSFPSTDTAISVGFVMVAITLSRAFDSVLARACVIALGLAACLTTGLLTIAFRDHYLTDVLAGWGLGAAAFSVCDWAADAIESGRPAGSR